MGFFFSGHIFLYLEGVISCSMSQITIHLPGSLREFAGAKIAEPLKVREAHAQGVIWRH